MGGSQILELVDEEVSTLGLHLAAKRAVGHERSDRSVHLLVEVDRALLGEAPAVLGEHLGQPSHVVTRTLDLCRITQAEPNE